MKRKEEKRLRLGKLTIQNLDTGRTILDTDEQRRVMCVTYPPQLAPTLLHIFFYASNFFAVTQKKTARSKRPAVFFYDRRTMRLQYRAVCSIILWKKRKECGNEKTSTSGS